MSIKFHHFYYSYVYLFFRRASKQTQSCCQVINATLISAGGVGPITAS